ncbi:MAG: LuxR C-terminal-related transcriptional regulator [Gammaproteobacteria bacterium]|nr:LuxR C-terminal-related transcriptional regulator [Gammaproteobacteria bacterium]
MHEFICDLQFLPLEAYQNLNFEIYIKNKHSQYIWANDFFLKKAAGCQTVEGIYEKYDDFFAWKDYAEKIQSNDKLVFESERELTFREQVVRHDGSRINIVSKKKPLFDKNKMLIGLIGFSIEAPPNFFPHTLSGREYDCLSLLAEGYTDKEIGKKLEISPRTAEFHIASVKEKWQITSRAKLAAKFTEYKL